MAIIDLREGGSRIDYGSLEERLFSVSRADEIIHVVVSSEDEALEIRAFLSLLRAGQWAVEGENFHMVCALTASLKRIHMPAAEFAHRDPAGLIT